jgi:hypothetical protein
MEVAGTRKSSSPVERDDIKLIGMFLSRYFEADGGSYILHARPDLTERNDEAVDAIAVDRNRRRLAIEHTLVQPFQGQVMDDRPFQGVFGQLSTDPSLRVRERSIHVVAPALAVPPRINWQGVAEKVRAWFIAEARDLPVGGAAHFTIPGLGFELGASVETTALPGCGGKVIVARMLPGTDCFVPVLQKALSKKVPKLVRAPADRRILLLESRDFAIGSTMVVDRLNEALALRQDARMVDGVWVVHTARWGSIGCVFFTRVWPGGFGTTFWVRDPGVPEARR